MFGDHFYHERTRKSVAIFGSLFNNIYVIRRHGTKVLGQIKVPIAYAPQRKFMERIAEMNSGGDPRIEDQTAIRLPRMSFEISNYQYDAARQLPKSNYIKCSGDETIKGCGTTSYQVYGGTPYNLTFELNIYGKQHDDCLQCVEQIIPFFNPQYTVSMKPLVGMSDIVEDVPITLQSVTFQDNFEGALEDRRIIIYTLTFEMKVMFYGPVNKTPRKVIEVIDIDFFDDWPSAFDPPQDPAYLETLRVEARQGEYPYHPINQDSDYTVNVDVINLTYPYSGDPSYRSWNIPEVSMNIGQTTEFNIGELYNHHRNPYTEYSLLDSNLSIWPDVGSINMDEEGNVTVEATQSPALSEMAYSLVNTRNQTIYTKIKFISLPDSTQDNLMKLEGDGYGFILTEPSTPSSIDLYALEDSA